MSPWQPSRSLSAGQVLSFTNANIAYYTSSTVDCSASNSSCGFTANGQGEPLEILPTGCPSATISTGNTREDIGFIWIRFGAETVVTTSAAGESVSLPLEGVSRLVAVPYRKLVNNSGLSVYNLEVSCPSTQTAVRTRR